MPKTSTHILTSLITQVSCASSGGSIFLIFVCELALSTHDEESVLQIVLENDLHT